MGRLQEEAARLRESLKSIRGRADKADQLEEDLAKSEVSNLFYSHWLQQHRVVDRPRLLARQSLNGRNTLASGEKYPGSTSQNEALSTLLNL